MDMSQGTCPRLAVSPQSIGLCLSGPADLQTRGPVDGTRGGAAARGTDPPPLICITGRRAEWEGCPANMAV